MTQVYLLGFAVGFAFGGLVTWKYGANVFSLNRIVAASRRTLTCVIPEPHEGEHKWEVDDEKAT